MKYIVLQDPYDPLSKKYPVVFHEDMVHADVARLVQRRGLRKQTLKVVSAGFVDLECQRTYGRSESLALGPAIGDVDLLSTTDYCPGCGKQTFIGEAFNGIYNCHWDCTETLLANGPVPPVKPTPTLAHAFTHTARLPAVVPIGAELPRHVTRALVARCLTLCRSVWDWEASSRMFLAVHWHAKQGMRKHPELSQAYLFHAYQVVALSDWEDNSEKIESLNLINAVQTIDPLNELRGQVYTVNTQHGTVTTHSLSEAKSIANSRAEK